MSLGSHIVRLTAGNGSAQFLQLLSLPLISRLFAPDEFGLYVLFAGALAVLSVFAGLRYDSAIILPRRDAPAVALAALVLAIALAASTVAGLGTLVATRFLAPGTSRQIVAIVGAGVVLSLVTGAVQRVVTAWLSRSGRFGSVGLLQLLVVATIVGLQVSLAAVGVSGLIALILGHVGGLLLGTAAFAMRMGELRRRIAVSLRRPRQLATVARRYSRFPKFMLPYGLSSTLRERLVHFVIGGLAGAGALGQFAMATRFASAPNSFLYQGVSPVMYAHAARAPREQVARDGAAIMELLAVVLVPAFAFIAIDGPLWIDRFLGQAWAGTGKYLLLLSIPYLSLALTSWLDRLFDAYGTQNRALYLDIGFTVVLVGTTALAASGGDGVTAATVFAAVFTAYELLWTALTYRTHDLPLSILKRPVLIVLVLGVACLAVMLLLKAVLPPTIRLIAFGAFAVLIVLGYLGHGAGRRRVAQLFARSGRPV